MLVVYRLSSAVGRLGSLLHLVATKNVWLSRSFIFCAISGHVSVFSFMVLGVDGFLLPTIPQGVVADWELSEAGSWSGCVFAGLRWV